MKGIVAAIDRILILLLILGTYSRTYIALIAMIISLQLIGLYQRKIPFIGKLLIGMSNARADMAATITGGYT